MTIRQNIAFALALKILFLGLALPGLATLWMAIIADMGASLLVTLNGMRLLGYGQQAQASREEAHGECDCCSHEEGHEHESGHADAEACGCDGSGHGHQ